MGKAWRKLNERIDGIFIGERNIVSSRWGGLVASAFLEGLGSAKRYSGAQSTIYGYGNDTTDQMVWNEYSVEDQSWIAAGKVGEKAGKIFEKGFDRPPTVRLESGTPVGVLVLNVKGR